MRKICSCFQRCRFLSARAGSRYKNLCIPFAELYHHESVSRGPDTDPKKAARFEKEALFMKNRWKYFIEDDPHYNPNLSLEGGYQIDLERSKKWPWQMD